MRYNIIIVNLDEKQTFTNKYKFLEVQENLIAMGYKQLTILRRKTCINTYYYKEIKKKGGQLDAI